MAWLAKHARRGRRPRDLAIQAFAAGLAVPEDTVRAAFADAIAGIRLPGEAGMPPETPPEDIADAAVAARLRLNMVPARIRRIDRDLAQRGVNWAPAELAAIDPGSSDPRADSSYLLHAGVRIILSGGAGIDMATVGEFARAMAPAGGVARPWPGKSSTGGPSVPVRSATPLQTMTTC